MKKRKNNLDERQELKLLDIEHKGCWFAFWGLVISIVIQMLIGNGDFKNIASECIVLILLSCYLEIALTKNGIWDRHLRPNPKTNLICSSVAGLVMGILYFIISYNNYHKVYGSIATAVFMFLFTFALCFIGLSVSAALYKKRKNQLENNLEEEE